MKLQAFMVNVERLVLLLAGLATTAMMVHVCVDVLGKNLFNRPLSGTIAIVSNFYMPVVTFIPLVLVQHYNQHISVEIIYNRFPAWLQRHVTGLTFLFSATVFALLAYYGGVEAMTKYRAGVFIIESQKRIPTWPGYFTTPIGYGMIAVYLLVQFLGYATGARQAARPNP